MTAENKVRALIIGANGLVGHKLGRALGNKGIGWSGTYNKRPEADLFKLDVTNPKEIEAMFSRYSPDAVFHCANLSGGVDFCEKNPGIAANFHLTATKEIANRCKETGATFVFISTDYVFDGTNGPYKEEDAANPLNLYGRLKLQAEQWIRRNLEKYLIVRTTNVFGWDPKTVTPNYVMNLYRTISDKKPFNAPSFLWGNPTYANDLAGAIAELWLDKADGIFHVVGGSFINRFEWSKQACKILELDSSLLNEVKEPPANIVPRPLRSWLSTEKFRSSYKTVLHDVSIGMELMKSDIYERGNRLCQT